MELLHEIKKENGLRVQWYKRNMGWGIDKGMRVYFPEFFTAKVFMEHRKTLDALMRYCANKLHLAMMRDAQTLVETMKNRYNVDIAEDPSNAIYLQNYAQGKSAILRAYIENSGKPHLDTCVTLDSPSATGFVATPGSFSDFIISDSSGGAMFAYTKDFLYMHLPFATFCVEEFIRLAEDAVVGGKLPEDLEAFAATDGEFRASKTLIEQHLIQLFSANKSKRIDNLTVGGENIFSLMKKYDMRYRIGLNSTAVVKIAIDLGKTPLQVKTFISNFLDKQNAI